jgi:alpha-glucuronidase
MRGSAATSRLGAVMLAAVTLLSTAAFADEKPPKSRAANMAAEKDESGTRVDAESAEDGYDLWLRYRPLEGELAPHLAADLSVIVTPRQMSATSRAALAELERGLGGLLGKSPTLSLDLRAHALVIGTPSSAPALARLDLPLDRLGDEGFVVRGARIDGKPVTVIAANDDTGVLYGAFALLRHLQMGERLAELDLAEAPRIRLRVLDHWDNLDGSIERGYAGRSLWDWAALPKRLDARYVDYARANASVGINGAVLNNVNASADILRPEYIEKVAALAGVLRPYGIRVYLSARFSAPMDIGGLVTADPLEPAVRAWWRAKTDEIYAAIPDFGGFLVKANSEGQPGPQDYGRSHADGANMLAAALEPHGGVVMWRAFVYASANPEDRAKQAYDEFAPLDGRFAPNVIVQVKNGPVDFQPREPFHPLFGAMRHTPLMAELEITKEYLGMASHLVYLGTLFEEVLSADTYAAGPGSTVARVIDGSLYGYPITGIAGVANTGSDRDWTGSTFNQANWYAFGRLAWNAALGAAAIADEWLRMTFSSDPRFLAAATEIMLRSREAAVDYMTPLGLAHLMATGSHYGPGPWVADLSRPEWNPVYYHRADADGIGFDRTASGSNAVAQYAEPLAERFADPATTPERYLLWFHRLPWDYRMRSGRTLWAELVLHYDHGVREVEAMQAAWSALEPYVDKGRFEKTTALLEVQRREAKWWRDACIAYFQSVSGRPLPAGVDPPDYSVGFYKTLSAPPDPR